MFGNNEPMFDLDFKPWADFFALKSQFFYLLIVKILLMSALALQLPGSGKANRINGKPQLKNVNLVVLSDGDFAQCVNGNFLPVPEDRLENLVRGKVVIASMPADVPQNYPRIWLSGLKKISRANPQNIFQGTEVKVNAVGGGQR